MIARGEFGGAAVYAVGIWWFTTGIILYLDRLPKRTFRWSMLGATLALAGAAYVMRVSSADTTVSGAYSAFTSAILVWAWVEMSFLMGFITGPRKHACAGPCAGWRHFFHATEAIIYNEIATLAGALAVAAMTWRAPNRVALWTYLILWIMRLSAKLNLFFGVPNLGEKFLPEHLQYLKGFFRRRQMNLLFPVSILASATGTFWLAKQVLLANSPFAAAAYALDCSLLALALLEHCFMVVPLPSERLWSWARSTRT